MNITEIDFANSVAFGQLMTILVIIAFALLFLISKKIDRSSGKSSKK